jgi:hypothetical protein
MVVGGGYLAYVNKFPPFNTGGLVDQLKKYMPQSDTAPGENAASGGGSGNNDMPQEGSGPLPQIQSFPMPGQQGQGPGNLGPIPPMADPSIAKPTFENYQVYNDYATALRMMYGQGNTPNLGSGGSDAYGDPNLGTTPVPGGLFGLNGSQGSSQPPPYPFLPNPLTPNTGMYRPPPVGAFPPMFPPMGPPMPLPPWLYQPIIPVGQPYWATWVSKRPLPYIYSTAQLFSIDLGIINHKLNGITINTFLQMGVSLNTIFPQGINLQNQYKIGADLTEFVTVYLRLHQYKPSKKPRHWNSGGIGIDIDLGNLGGSINDMIQGIMNKVKGKLSNSGIDFDFGSGSGSGSGFDFGDMFNNSNTNWHIDDNGNESSGTGSMPGAGTGLNDMFGGMFGNLFGGSSGGNNNNNNNNNVSIPSAQSINSDVFNQLRSMGIPGFHARAMLADTRPKIGFMNQRNSNSLQPQIKRVRNPSNRHLNKVSFM